MLSLSLSIPLPLPHPLSLRSRAVRAGLLYHVLAHVQLQHNVPTHTQTHTDQLLFPLHEHADTQFAKLLLSKSS